MTNIVFDIGGTKMRVARALGGEVFSEPLTAPTPQYPEEGVSLLAELASRAAEGEQVEKIAGGIAAIFGESDAVIENSSNLKGWVGVDLREELAKHMPATLIVENDASVVGLGEAHFGAGKGSDVVVYLTVSTGVGGSRIVDGVIDRGAFGFEPGHQILNIKTRETLETLVSGRGFEERFGCKPYEVTDPDVWGEAAHRLAVGIHNTILHWSPNVVVLGGPMMVGDPSIPVELVQKHLGEIMQIFKSLPEVRLATLRDHGGLYGGLVLLREQGN